MSLPVLSTRTAAAVELVPLLGRDGRDMIVVIIKRRIGFGAGTRTAFLPDAEIRLADVPWDDEPLSSTKWPSDVCLRKPSTDVVVVGEACEKANVPVKELDVLVRVGPVQKALRVSGPRVFYKGAVGLALSAPEPFTSLPLRWELAYGGTDLGDPKKGVRDARNPVGRGVASDPRTLLHKPAPQIEDPRALWGGPTAPVPAGVAPLPPHFLPRSSFAGTYDDKWARERMPLLPLDFDERHNQIAPAELICPEYLRGGERLELLNVSPLGVLHCTLPRLAFGVLASRDDGKEEHPVVLDTLVIDTLTPAVEMVWRTAIPQGRLRRSLRGVSVYEKRVL